MVRLAKQQCYTATACASGGHEALLAARLRHPTPAQPTTNQAAGAAINNPFPPRLLTTQQTTMQTRMRKGSTLCVMQCVVRMQHRCP